MTGTQNGWGDLPEFEQEALDLDQERQDRAGPTGEELQAMIRAARGGDPPVPFRGFA